MRRRCESDGCAFGRGVEVARVAPTSRAHRAGIVVSGAEGARGVVPRRAPPAPPRRSASTSAMRAVQPPLVHCAAQASRNTRAPLRKCRRYVLLMVTDQDTTSLFHRL